MEEPLRLSNYMIEWNIEKPAINKNKFEKLYVTTCCHYFFPIATDL